MCVSTPLCAQIVLPVKKLKHLSQKALKIRVLGWKGIHTNTPLLPKFIVTTGTTNTPLLPKFIIIIDALHGYKTNMFSKGVMFYFVYSSFA